MYMCEKMLEGGTNLLVSIINLLRFRVRNFIPSAVRIIRQVRHRRHDLVEAGYDLLYCDTPISPDSNYPE